MNLKDKIGQRLVLSFDGTELTETLQNWLLDCRPGGLILFGRNIRSLEQVAALNHDLQDFARRNGLPPFILSLDEEGGRVSRMPAEGLMWIAPSQMAQRAAGLEAVRQSAEVIAHRLKMLGLNLNFAPVADVNNNPANPVIGSRSFGSDPEQVAEAVVTAVQAYLQEGVGCCVKHFPGHGDTAVDSHHGLPLVKHSRERLDKVELVPFRRAFEAGVPALMTAHMIFEELEPDLPVTLSHRFLVDLLRNELGFNGLVFTDALEMKAIADRYAPSIAALTTLRAGSDIAMPCFNMEIQRDICESLLEAAQNREFNPEEGLQRVLDFKEKFCKEQATLTGLALLEQETQDAGIIREIARHSVTLVSARPDFEFPSRPQHAAVIDFALPVASLVEEGRQASHLLRQVLAQEWPSLRYLKIDAFKAEMQQALALELARSADALVVLVRNARRLEGQGKALKAILEVAPHAIVVAARDPYDLKLAGNAAACLATYGDPPCSIYALAEVLTGKIKPAGSLPVQMEG